MKKQHIFTIIIMVLITLISVMCAIVVCKVLGDAVDTYLSEINGYSSIEEMNDQTTTNEDNHTSSTEGYTEYRYGLYSMTGDNKNIVIERWITDRGNVNGIDCKYAFNIKDENNLDLLVHHEDSVCIHNDSSDGELPYVIITKNNNEIVKVDIYINSRVRFETVVISNNED